MSIKNKIGKIYLLIDEYKWGIHMPKSALQTLSLKKILAIVVVLIFVTFALNDNSTYPNEPKKIAKQFFLACINNDFDEARKYMATTSNEREFLAQQYYKNFLRGKYGKNRDDIEIKTSIDYEGKNSIDIDIFIQNRSTNHLKNRFTSNYPKHSLSDETIRLIKIGDKWKIK